MVGSGACLALLGSGSNVGCGPASGGGVGGTAYTGGTTTTTIRNGTGTSTTTTTSTGGTTTTSTGGTTTTSTGGTTTTTTSSTTSTTSGNVCGASAVFTEDNGDHSSTAQIFAMPSNAAGTTVAIYGPAKVGGGNSFISGKIDVTGFNSNQAVGVYMATSPDCGSSCSSMGTTCNCGAGQQPITLDGNACGPSTSQTAVADANGTFPIQDLGSVADNNVVILVAQ